MPVSVSVAATVARNNPNPSVVTAFARRSKPVPEPATAEEALDSPLRRPSTMDNSSEDLTGGFRDVKVQTTYRVIDSKLFKGIIYTAIMMNALQIGLSTDHKGEVWDVIWRYCEHFFTALFTMEALAKLYFMRFDYFKDIWNNLDFFIVLMAVLETWILPAFMSGGAGMRKFMILRLVRMVRIVRMLKLLRIFKQLLILIEGIINSLQSMFWVTVLLIFILYICGIFCVQIIGEADYPAREDEEALIVSEALNGWNNRLYFGTVTRAMFSLLSICLLAEWADIGRPVLEFQLIVFPFFIFFVVFTTLGILNVIVGVIVENTMAATTAVRDEDLGRQKSEKLQQVREIRDVLFQIDEDGDRQISVSEFEAGMANNKGLREILAGIDLPKGFKPKEMHTMLDDDGSGVVADTEFLQAMFRLIYCNEFQQLCLMKLSMNQIKAQISDLKMETARDIQASTDRVVREMETFRVQMSVAMNVPLHLPRPLAQVAEEDESIDQHVTQDESHAPESRVSCPVHEPASEPSRASPSSNNNGNKGSVPPHELKSAPVDKILNEVYRENTETPLIPRPPRNDPSRGGAARPVPPLLWRNDLMSSLERRSNDFTGRLPVGAKTIGTEANSGEDSSGKATPPTPTKQVPPIANLEKRLSPAGVAQPDEVSV